MSWSGCHCYGDGCCPGVGCHCHGADVIAMEQLSLSCSGCPCHGVDCHYMELTVIVMELTGIVMERLSLSWSWLLLSWSSCHCHGVLAFHGRSRCSSICLVHIYVHCTLYIHIPLQARFLYRVSGYFWDSVLWNWN